jgi:hypothetical protein
LRCPDETDVYAIRKYLALVFPRQGKTLPVPHDQDVFQVVFSASPDRLADAGRNFEEPNIRVLGPMTRSWQMPGDDEHRLCANDSDLNAS